MLSSVNIKLINIKRGGTMNTEKLVTSLKVGNITVEMRGE